MAGLIKRIARRSKTAPPRLRLPKIVLVMDGRRVGLVTSLRITQKNGAVLDLGAGTLTMSYL